MTANTFDIMKMKHVIILAILMVSATQLCAGLVPEDQARLVASRFYYERYSARSGITDDQVKVISTVTEKSGDIPVYYAFNFAPEGFVVVAAQDASVPVLAYSFYGRYSTGDHPENFRAWMKQYRDELSSAAVNGTAGSEQTAALWDYYLQTPATDIMPFSGREISPLLTSTWDQSNYYNEMCPADPLGPGGHCLTGCVATAMGQVMNYFRWPDTGVGTYTYECPPYGTLSADFGNTTYQWALMETSLSHNNLSVAELLYHLGVSVDMVYGPSGSGMYNHKAAWSLKTYFKYSPETQYVFRDSTTMDWDSLIVAHLDQHIPMYYAGWSVPDTVGHAFVCDGYQGESYYHFNWGWGGSYDGYFYTNALTPGGNNFNLAQELIIHAFPDTTQYTYPGYCEGFTEITTLFGTLDDGSGPIYGYNNGSDCSWLIAPADSINGVTLEFLRFDLGDGDTLRVFDGDTVSAPLLAALTGDDLPGEISTSGNQMLLTFAADGAGSGEGFLAGFSSGIPVFCSGTTILNNPADTLTDGSGNWDYHNSSLCMWRILPQDATTVTLYFMDFITEEGPDMLKIYDLQTQQLLAEYTGSYGSAPPDPVTSPSGKMFLIFSTNNSGTAPGWNAYYESDAVGLEENATGSLPVRIFPNPSNGTFSIEKAAGFDNDTRLAIVDVYGRTVHMEKIRGNQSSFILNAKHLAPGLYYLSLSGQGSVAITKKIIIH